VPVPQTNAPAGVELSADFAASSITVDESPGALPSLPTLPPSQVEHVAESAVSLAPPLKPSSDVNKLQPPTMARGTRTPTRTAIPADRRELSAPMFFQA
jgi:hypothetical protein